MFLGILAVSSILVAGESLAEEKTQGLQRWEVARSGDFSLAHKLYLTSKSDCFEEQALNLLYLSYAYYRCKDMNNAMLIFSNIDVLLRGWIGKDKVNNLSEMD